MRGLDSLGYPRILDPAKVIREKIKARSLPTPDPFGDRGVVLLPAWRNANEEKFLRRQAEYELLRKALLYWDVVCWPQIQPIDMTAPFDQAVKRTSELSAIAEPEFDVLIREGVLQTLAIPVAPDFRTGPRPATLTPESVIDLHIDTYLNLEYHEPGCWAIAEAADRFIEPSGLVPSAEGALWTLSNLLPTPTFQVGYTDIVEFRRKHRQELLALRTQIDEFSAEIIKAPDSAHIYSATMRRLDSAIADVWKRIEEDRKHFARSTMRVAIAMLEGAFHGAVAGEAVSEFLTFPLATAAIGSAIAGAAVLGSIEVAKDMVANPAGVPGPAGYLYSYLKDAKKEGIVESM
jgi:hypothetical protein